MSCRCVATACSFSRPFGRGKRSGDFQPDFRNSAYLQNTFRRLLVGHDKSARSAFDRTLWQALVWALAVMLGLALVTGWLLSRLVLRRIAALL